MNMQTVMQAAIALGYENPSVEIDNTVWVGPDDDRTYPPMEPILAKAAQIESERTAVRERAILKLRDLGLDADEIVSLLGV